MSDLIRRKDALAYPLSWEHYDRENGDVKFMCGVESYREHIESLPSAERKGKWELAEDGWYCTACELYPPFDCDPEEKGIPFCPNCGADMRGEEDEVD